MAQHVLFDHVVHDYAKDLIDAYPYAQGTPTLHFRRIATEFLNLMNEAGEFKRGVKGMEQELDECEDKELRNAFLDAVGSYCAA